MQAREYTDLSATAGDVELVVAHTQSKNALVHAVTISIELEALFE